MRDDNNEFAFLVLHLPKNAPKEELGNWNERLDCKLKAAVSSRRRSLPSNSSS